MMYDSRLNGLAHMHIQKNKEINLVQVLDKFDASEKGELPLYIFRLLLQNQNSILKTSLNLVIAFNYRQYITLGFVFLFRLNAYSLKLTCF